MLLYTYDCWEIVGGLCEVIGWTSKIQKVSLRKKERVENQGRA